MSVAMCDGNQLRNQKQQQKKKNSMKTVKNIVRNLCRPAALVVLGLGLLAQTSQAAIIKVQVRVPGYTQRGSGWTLVLPELNLGGKVVWDVGRGSYVTDRVSNGEYIQITVSPSVPAETLARRIQLIGARSTTGLQSWFNVPLPFVIICTPLPQNDKVWVSVLTNLGYYERRIPIGSR